MGWDKDCDRALNAIETATGKRCYFAIGHWFVIHDVRR
jgi:hypothetical protein